MAKKTAKRWMGWLLLVCLILPLAACGAGGKQKGGEEPALRDCAIIHEPEFGGVYIKATIDEFNALGFAYGDSVNVAFSNGYVLEDIPYYNGYYTENGKPLLIAYPGYDYVKAAINNGDDLWTVAGLGESDLASVTLGERGKYLEIQNARDIHYEDDRTLYASDVVFANFRAIRAGGIKDGVLYRSASPCDNQHNRAPYVDALIAEAGVQFILDLADNEEKIGKYIASPDFASPYFLSLYEAGGVLPIALNMNFGSEEFRSKIAGGFTAMAHCDGPYLIHCTEGKDRTGFVCMLLEALAGADYREIVDDYMLTYDNYYGITQESDKAKYDVIVDQLLDPMIRTVVGEEGIDIKAAELSGYAEAFLRNAGMSDADIELLRTRISG